MTFTPAGLCYSDSMNPESLLLPVAEPFAGGLVAEAFGGGPVAEPFGGGPVGSGGPVADCAYTPSALPTYLATTSLGT